MRFSLILFKLNNELKQIQKYYLLFTNCEKRTHEKSKPALHYRSPSSV
ncbi:MAG: hypothetical protein OJF59_001997 [Cytophagales bacterium]|nr:MAG: hypothetical protein OJF59_001997 [Cytophagales bacterium]